MLEYINLLDLRTFSFAFCVQNFSLWIIFFIFACYHKNFSDTFTLSLCPLLLSAAYVLFTFQGIVNGFTTIALANTMVIATLCLIAKWIRSFFELENLNIGYYAFITGFTFITQSYLVFFAKDNCIRLTLLNFTFAVVLADISFLLFNCRVAAIKKISAISGIGTGLLSAFFLYKSVNSFLSPQLFANTFEASHSGQPKAIALMTLILGMTFFISLFISLILMVNLKLQTRILERESTLKCYADELEEINATKNKFFSMISHDLRGPIGSIDGLLGVILSNMDENDSNIKKMKLLKDASGGLREFLNNLLDWAMTQSKNIECMPENLCVSTLVDEIINLKKIDAIEKKIAVENRVPPETVVFADRKMLVTVFLNLLSNALKFTGENGKITFTASSAGGRMEISITDNGCGMSGEYIENLFKIGQTKASKGTRGESGRGLGLIVCREFIGRNNGFINIKSKTGAGSTFTITLPSGNAAA